MQINSRTIVSVVATVSMVVLTVLLAVFSPPTHTGKQVEPAANQAPIISDR